MRTGLLRWLLWTPRRAYLTAGVAAAGVLAVLLLTVPAGGGASPPRTLPAPPSSGPAAAPAGPGTAPAAESPRVGTEELTPSATHQAGITATARRFTAVWAGGAATRSTRAWLDALRPVTDPALLDGLRHTDPAALPVGRVTGAELLTGGATYGAVEVHLSTGRRVTVQVVHDGAAWRVADIQPVPDSAPAAGA